MAATPQSRRQRRSARRVPRPYLALLGVPLGITAALLTGDIWMVVPLAAGAWGWAPRDSGWYCAIAVGRGVGATEWAAVGASALAAVPGSRAVIGLGLGASPGLLALSAPPTPATRASRKPA